MPVVRQQGYQPRGSPAEADMLEVDEEGLDKLDRTILSTIIQKFGGGRWDSTPWRLRFLKNRCPGGCVQALSVKIGFLQRTPRTGGNGGLIPTWEAAAGGGGESAEKRNESTVACAAGPAPPISASHSGHSLYACLQPIFILYGYEKRREGSTNWRNTTCSDQGGGLPRLSAGHSFREPSA